MVSGISSRIKLYCAPMEDFEPPEVDMVLTSPPYWKRELYDGDNPVQSSNRYPTYTGWLEGFLSVLLEKSVKAVRPGGWVVLNVDNFKIGSYEYRLIQDSLKIMLGLGMGDPKEVFDYAMPTMGDSSNKETVLCWVKGQEALKTEPITEEVQGFEFDISRCSVCGKTFPNPELKNGVCPSCLVKGVELAVCKGCGKEFIRKNKIHDFHSANCRARWNRKQWRKKNPVKETRIFTCKVCGEEFETSLLGHFTTCNTCKEKKDIANRTKICKYRECRTSFVDTSHKNSMTYCCDEHRRREKLFRSGKVSSVSQFRKPDPILG